jgi:hypothetical protein
MEQAAQASNRTNTPALPAAITTAASLGRPAASTRAGTAPDSIQMSTWEWEGGQDSARSQGPGASPANLGDVLCLGGSVA